LKFTSVEHKKRLSFFSATPIAENTALLVGSAVEGDASRRVKQRFVQETWFGGLLLNSLR
jgi:hypothetical protein